MVVPSGLGLPASRNALEGRGLVFRLLLWTCPWCLGCVQLWALYSSLACWLGQEAGWTHRGLSRGHLSNTCPPPFNPLVIDCPASCVCLHCLGVQLDRAPFWQVPQPGTAALDVQRTVHICQVCVCSRHPRREESSGKPRVFAVPRASGR